MNKLPDYVCEEMRQTFKELSSDELLSKCLHGGTQNSNESFHHLIWERCPKEIFVGKDRLQIAVDDASIVYNDGEMGRVDIFKNLNLTVGRHQRITYLKIDRKRVRSANTQGMEVSKKRRTERSIAAARETDDRDGYIPGGY